MRAFSQLLLAILLVLGSCTALASDFVPRATGEEWSKWNQETRMVFIYGYVSGHSRGFRDGCEMGEKIYSKKPAGLPGEKCLRTNPEWSKKYLETYADQITTFYKTYPDNQNVPVWRVLEGLSDDRNFSLERMRAYGASIGNPAKK